MEVIIMDFLLCLEVVDITIKKDVGMIILEVLVAFGYQKRLLIGLRPRYILINQNGMLLG